MNHNKLSPPIDLSGAVRRRLALAAVCAGTALALPAHAELDVVPRVGITGMWIDNINLATSGQSQQEEYIGQLTPGLRVTQSGRRVNTFLDYEAQALFYKNDSDRNEVFHHGNLNVNVEAVPDWFFVDVGGRYAQSILDPTQPANQNNLFDVGNLVDTASATVRPSLRHTFDKVELLADYTRGFVDYRETVDNGSAAVAQADDSDNNDANFRLSSTDKDAPVTWMGRYRYEHVEYDRALPFKYERADAELGVRITRSLRLIGRGGAESDPTDSVADGGLDESFWQGGFSWSRDERNELRVLVGERFFGTSYEALLRLAGRIVSGEVGYNEEPTTQSQQFALAQQPTAAVPNPIPDPQFGRIEPQTFLSKRLYGRLALTGRFTKITFDVNSERREYAQLGNAEDRFRGAQVTASRRFGPRTTGEIGASVNKAELREGGEYDDKVYHLSLQRSFGQRTSLLLAANHVERSGELQDYDANWLSLGLQMTF